MERAVIILPETSCADRWLRVLPAPERRRQQFWLLGAGCNRHVIDKECRHPVHASRAGMTLFGEYLARALFAETGIECAFGGVEPDVPTARPAGLHPTDHDGWSENATCIFPWPRPPPPRRSRKDWRPCGLRRNNSPRAPPLAGKRCRAPRPLSHRSPTR